MIIICLSTITYPQESTDTESSKFKIGKNMKENQNPKLDINSAEKGEMLGVGLSSTYVDKIIEYKEITGGFEKIEELKRIPGIGEKTYKKLADHFVIESKITKNRLPINLSDENTLKYFGLNKKEIKNIMKLRAEGKFITNNIELKKSLNNEAIYLSLRDRIDYREN